MAKYFLKYTTDRRKLFFKSCSLKKEIPLTVGTAVPAQISNSKWVGIPSALLELLQMDIESRSRNWWKVITKGMFMLNTKRNHQDTKIGHLKNR